MGLIAEETPVKLIEKAEKTKRLLLGVKKRLWLYEVAKKRRFEKKRLQAILLHHSTRRHSQPSLVRKGTNLPAFPKKTVNLSNIVKKWPVSLYLAWRSNISTQAEPKETSGPKNLMIFKKSQIYNKKKVHNRTRTSGCSRAIWTRITE